MTSGFIRKKVSTLTLGERMKKIRADRRLSLHDISKHTGIQMRYLEALEEENFDKLPAEVYVKGFLRSFAQYVGVRSDGLIRLYEREQGINKNLQKDEKNDQETLTRKRSSFSHWTLTPKTITVSAIIIIVFLSIFYLYSQFKNFVSEPNLVVTEPQSGRIIENPSIAIKGYTDASARVFINGQGVLVDENGQFEEIIELQQGINRIDVVAVNRFDEEAQEQLVFEADFSEPEEEIQEASASKHIIRFRADTQATPLFVTIDGEQVYGSIINPEDTLEFSADEEVVVTAGKGNEIYVTIDERPEMVLDDSNGLVQEILLPLDNSEDN